MSAETNTVPSSPAELLGDAHPLIEQLGSPEEFLAAPAGRDLLAFTTVRDLASLRGFLDEYRARVLEPVELPAIVAAHGHATRGEARELILLDQRLAAEVALREFAVASCRVGQRQLSKLRPLRDRRVVGRYLAAIESGDARGWHTLVYGVSLAMFSLPLRQGLQNYVEQTTAVLIGRAVASLRLPEATSVALQAEQSARVPQLISLAVAGSGPLRVC